MTYSLTRDRKTFKTYEAARAAAAYVNRYGAQRGRYLWRAMARHDGLYELVRHPR